MKQVEPATISADALLLAAAAIYANGYRSLGHGSYEFVLTERDALEAASRLAAEHYKMAMELAEIVNARLGCHTTPPTSKTRGRW